MTIVYNPFTDNLDYRGASGGGGGITSVDGQASLVAPTTTVTTVGTVATVENRAWESQYVVDPSTTPGQRGTFSTIQAALDQAVLDGMLANSPRKIILRATSFVEDLVIPPGAMLYGSTFCNPTGGGLVPAFPRIVGVHTFSGIGFVGFNNILFVNATIFDTFTGALSLVYADNCTFSGLSGFHFTGEGCLLNCTDCTFLVSGPAATFDLSGALALRNCTSTVSSTIMTTINVRITMISCQGFGNIELGIGSELAAYQCRFLNNTMAFCITGAGGFGSLLQDVIFTNGSGVANTTGPWVMENCSSTTGLVYETGTVVYTNSISGVTQQGSTIRSISVNGNYTIFLQDHYVGVDTSGGPITINLPSGASASAQQNQCFIIKDETGNAAANPISVTSSGGTLTIDGATTRTINSNYGSITVKFDGTNYFII